MLRNIAGPHIQTLTDDAKRLLSGRTGSLKVCHPALDVPRIVDWSHRNPDAHLDLRVIDDSANLDNCLELCKRACETFKGLLFTIDPDHLWLEVVINEKFMFGDELRRLGDVTVVCAEYIFGAGYRPVGFQIPVGNIAKINGATIQGITYNLQTSEMNLIREAVRRLTSLRGAVGYHNYTVPGSQMSNWLDLRHERMALELPDDTQWWLSEGLYDHGIIDGNLQGWRYEPWHQSADMVAGYLRRVSQHLANDLSVIGSTPFGAGPTQDWIDRGFQYDNENVITQIFTEAYPVDATVSPVIGTGLKKLIPFLGQPLESEVYHFAGSPIETSLAVFANGQGTWYRASNETVGVRADGYIYSDHGNTGDGIMRQVYPHPLLTP